MLAFWNRFLEHKAWGLMGVIATVALTILAILVTDGGDKSVQFLKLGETGESGLFRETATHIACGKGLKDLAPPLRATAPRPFRGQLCLVTVEIANASTAQAPSIVRGYLYVDRKSYFSQAVEPTQNTPPTLSEGEGTTVRVIFTLPQHETPTRLQLFGPASLPPNAEPPDGKPIEYELSVPPT